MEMLLLTIAGLGIVMLLGAHYAYWRGRPEFPPAQPLRGDAGHAKVRAARQPPKRVRTG